MVGAASAASFYAPIEKVKKWSWETNHGPSRGHLLLGAAAYRRQLDPSPTSSAFYASIPQRCALLGAALRSHVGRRQRQLRPHHALPRDVPRHWSSHRRHAGCRHAYAAHVLNGQAATLFHTRAAPACINMAGVVVALIGVAIVSYAGHQKEDATQSRRAHRSSMSWLGARPCRHVRHFLFPAFPLPPRTAAAPFRHAAEGIGVNHLYSMLPAYVFIMGGGAIINMAYCFIRLALVKNLSNLLKICACPKHHREECCNGSHGNIVAGTSSFSSTLGASPSPTVSATSTGCST